MAPLSSIIASAGAASLAARGFSYQNNIVTFYMPGWITSASFQVSDLMISAGQDPSTYNHVGDIHTSDNSTPGTAALSFVAGRHKTSDVAQWWNSRVSATQNTFGHTAGQLNFGYIGDLIIKIAQPRSGAVTPFTLHGAGLAQGSDDNGSNWWFGGSSCTYVASGFANCNATDDSGRPYRITFARGEDSAINQIKVGEILALWSEPVNTGE